MIRTMIWVLSVALCVAGCSYQAWYESARLNAELKCQGLPQGAYEDCMARVNQKSYQDYKRESAGASSPEK